MLIQYKKDMEKIAMGLLSFMPEQKNIKKLQQTICEYEENADWHLYLWKEEGFLGAIGLRIENDINAVIQHITVDPSHRNVGIGKKMVEKIIKLYEKKYAVCPDEFTQAFFNKCT